jgi:hypothetical protein
MKYLHITLTVAAILFIAGCSPMTFNSAQQKGNDKLSARDIFNLVSGNTLTLTAYDFDGKVYFNEKGKLAGIDNEGQNDTGSWDIKDNDQLCIKFKVWYYGDLNCYSVVTDNERSIVSFFTSNGAAYYTGSIARGDSSGLAVQVKTKQSSKYLRQTLAEEQTAPLQPRDPALQSGNQSPSPPQSANISTSSSVRQLAQKCNGCNLSGANLKEAMLVKAELEGADLSRADLRYANLRRARMAGANLSGALLNHANLPGADLRECNLRGADLSGANLLLTDLTDADLTGANLTNAHIENTIGIER